MNLAASAKPASVVGDARGVGLIESSMLERVATVNSGFVSQGLLIQLRSHHPTGCLLSELVQVVDGHYVVRTTVEVDGQAIATAMASASTIEVAEDQARARVVAVLGLTPLNLAESRSTVEPKPEVAAARIPDMVPAAMPVSEPPAVVDVAAADVPAPPEVTAPQSTTSKAAKSTKSKAKSPKAKVTPKVEVPPPPEPVVETTVGADDAGEMEIEYEFTLDNGEVIESSAADDVPPEEPTIDLSDAIAQIGTEIERIGWTKKQGSAYLQETYGKRTRAELTEDELLGFLHNLKARPSKVQPALSDLPF
ncbi:hypothetical protein IQ266_11860 [filamentous cyanobacterium LEGE 11480]|uniref:Uncharacterized protein n=1 Tax=Romeriopsis navalis LEGE 11480 TaxID=2777977 RepID=A0A928VQ16_9CYAN|nr:hypothetical protein [Romeriopsis navalis]MBE9030427.1 hypothetical protein [Romeriopsis navalis LEGE 11480]